MNKDTAIICDYCTCTIDSHHRHCHLIRSGYLEGSKIHYGIFGVSFWSRGFFGFHFKPKGFFGFNLCPHLHFPITSNLEYPNLDGMLVRDRVTPSSMSLVPIYTPGWRETMWSKDSFLPKETTRWQGLGLKPPIFRSEVQRGNHCAPTDTLTYRCHNKSLTMFNII